MDEAEDSGDSAAWLLRDWVIHPPAEVGHQEFIFLTKWGECKSRYDLADLTRIELTLQRDSVHFSGDLQLLFVGGPHGGKFSENDLL